MNKKILDHLSAFCASKGFPFDGLSDDVLETLQYSGKEIYSVIISHHRWWNETFNVVDIDDLLIGFNGAETTGDTNAYDLGWEFDIESCCEVSKHTETHTVITYKPIRE